jgi:3-oxoacyl-[acyl-carrier-protein] synthase-3
MNQHVRVKISGVGHYVPDYVLTNAELEKIVDTSDEWIVTRTGIKERRILKDPDKATSYMATRAAKEVLERTGTDPNEIDAILVATVTPDYLFPATACIVQQEIGATNAFGYDIEAACSGFLFALTSGSSLIESGRAKKVLVIGADKMSSIIDMSDRTTSILFGDGAGAVLLEASTDDTGIIDFIQRSSGENNEALIMLAGGSRHPASAETVSNKMHVITQEGKTVFKMATMGMADVAAEIMERNGLTSDDVAWLVPHQANLRIIDATANRMGISRDKVMINIDRYGNTTAATIPLCLYDWKDKLKKGDNLILAAFGGGFTWGSVYVKWSL